MTSKTELPDGTMVLHFHDGLGGTAGLPIRKCPEDGPSRPRDIVFSAVQAMCGLNDTVAAVNADPHLSDEGKQHKLQKLRPLWQEAQKKLTDLEANVVTLEVDYKHAMANFHATDVPAYEPSDAVSFLADAERRKWFETQPLDKRTEILRRITDEEHKELRFAIARSPIPSRERDIVRTRIKEARLDTDPEYADGLRKREASIEWAKINLRTLMNKLNENRGRGNVTPLKAA